MKRTTISFKSKIISISLLLLAILISCATAWDGTFLLYVFNSDGVTVPTGRTDESMVNGLHFETYLKMTASGDTSRHETEQSMPLFRYTVEEYEGRCYAHIAISLGNYKKWNGSIWEPIDYLDGDTIKIRAVDLEEPFYGEGTGYWGFGELGFSFNQADWVEPTFVVDTFFHICRSPRGKYAGVEIPDVNFLSFAFPDPFTEMTTVKYGVAETALVTIEITDKQLNSVKYLVDEIQDAGFQKVTWDGTDQNGNYVEPGVYHFYYKTGNFKADIKLEYDGKK